MTVEPSIIVGRLAAVSDCVVMLAGRRWSRARLTHGHTVGGFSSTYLSWLGMRHRCGNPTDVSWKYYGGRGISVWPEWRSSFAAFVRDCGPRPENTTLDRISNEDHYRPGAVRWSTAVEQVRNRRPRGSGFAPVEPAPWDADADARTVARECLRESLDDGGPAFQRDVEAPKPYSGSPGPNRVQDGSQGRGR